MTHRRTVLLTAFFLLAVALVGGGFAYDRLRRLSERHEHVRGVLGAIELLRAPGDDATTASPADVERLRLALERLDALALRGEAERTRDELRRSLELPASDTLSDDAERIAAALAVELSRAVERAEERTTALGADFLQIAVIGGPLVAALAAGALLTSIYLPLRRAARATSVVAAAEAVAGVSTELAGLLRGLDAERRARMIDLMRTGHLAALGTLAAGIAHEVRNPLMAVSAMAASARRRLTNDQFDRTALGDELDRIEAETERAGKLLGEILQLAPSSAPRRERFDLIAELREIAAVVEARAGILRETVRFEHPPVFVLDGYPSRIRPILFNLLLNSVDSCRAAGTLTAGAVRVSIARVDADASTDSIGFARVVVDDTGVGFGPEVADHLFEPFFSTKGRAGSGLGLFLSEGLARECGGTLRGRSRGAMQGAGFELTLPLEPERRDGDRE